MTRLESFQTSIYNFNESLKSYFEAPKTKVWSSKDYLHVASWFTIVAPLFAGLTLGITAGLNSLFGRAKPLPHEEKVDALKSAIFRSPSSEKKPQTAPDPLKALATPQPPETSTSRPTMVSFVLRSWKSLSSADKITVTLDERLAGPEAENARELLVNAMRKSFPDTVTSSAEYNNFIHQLKANERNEASNLDVIHALIELGRDFSNQKALPENVLAKVAAFIFVVSNYATKLPLPKDKTSPFEQQRFETQRNIFHQIVDNQENANDDVLAQLAQKLRPYAFSWPKTRTP